MRLIAGIVLAAFLAAAAAAQDDSDGDGKLYKWVDEDGNVTYQDTPPPDSGGRVETIAEPVSAADTGGPETPDVDITFYAIDACEACDLVRQLLRERGIPFEEKNAEGDREVQDELREVAGALSVPVVQIGDQILKGYNRELLLNELGEEGFPTEIDEGAATADTGAGGEAEQAADTDATGAAGEEAATGEQAPAEGEDPFDEDNIFAEDDGGGSGGDDVTEWEEIPEDERIPVSQ